MRRTHGEASGGCQRPGTESPRLVNDPFATTMCQDGRWGPVSYRTGAMPGIWKWPTRSITTSPRRAIPFSRPHRHIPLPDAVFIDFFTHKRSRSAGAYTVCSQLAGTISVVHRRHNLPYHFVDVPAPPLQCSRVINLRRESSALLGSESRVSRFRPRSRAFSTLNSAGGRLDVAERGSNNLARSRATFLPARRRTRSADWEYLSYHSISPGHPTDGLNLTMGCLSASTCRVWHGMAFLFGRDVHDRERALRWPVDRERHQRSRRSQHRESRCDRFAHWLVPSNRRWFSLIRFPGETHYTAWPPSTQGRTPERFSTDWYGGADAFVTQADGSYYDCLATRSTA